jgi:uncharacterized protein with GYD domain
VKDTIKRAEAFKSAVEKAGGKFLSEYYTLGRYDIITTIEAPDDEAIASILLNTGSLGNVRSETVRAFPMSEAAKIKAIEIRSQVTLNITCYIMISPIVLFYALALVRVNHPNVNILIMAG